MALRNVYGHAFSSNGWPMVDEGNCTWVDIPGTEPAVRIQIQNGQPLQILRAFVADINAYVEHVTDADTGCWTAGNSVETSNHLSGTAVDVDWERHPFRIANAGWSQQQLATIREIQDFYEGTVFFGNDWSDPKDAMHFQLASLANGGDIDTYGNPQTQDFINRKIRPDGFSKFRRGDAPVAPDAAVIFARATGLSLTKATEILPTMQEGVRLAECTTPRRIGMFYAQTGTESADFNATEEYASGAEYEGRVDLGNTEPGDGVRFKGRTWIQITGRHNYGQFSQWAHDNGLVPTPTYFVDNPTELSDVKWAGIGAAWYWTVERPQINSLCDQGDVVGVTHAVNGGEHGLADRQARYTRAMAQGDQLLTILTGGDDDFMSALSDAEQRELLENTRQDAVYRRKSLSMFSHLGEGEVNTCAGFSWTSDGLIHPQFVDWAARYGHVDSVAILLEMAGADLKTYPEKADAVVVATAALSDIKAANPTRFAAALAQIEATKPNLLQNYLATRGAA